MVNINETAKDVIKGVNSPEAYDLLKGFDRYAAYIDDGDTHRRVQAQNHEILQKLKEMGATEVDLQIMKYDGSNDIWKIKL
jgi:imidazole glycerol phosphate synthase subunit HisF